MRKLKLAVFVGMVLLFAGALHADSIGDGRVGVQPAPPSDPPPSCGGFQFSANGGGQVSSSCEVTGSEVTSITVAVPTTEANGGLQIFSSLTSNVTGNLPSWLPPSIVTALSQFNWSSSCGSGFVGDVAVSECTLAAPAVPPNSSGILNLLTYAGIINDGDCDADDFVFGVPVGCDFNFTTNTDSLNQLFAPYATVDAGVNGAPLAPFTPEPSTAILFGLGILPMLPFALRRARRVN
jgi:hypothetical protein